MTDYPSTALVRTLLSTIVSLPPHIAAAGPVALIDAMKVRAPSASSAEFAEALRLAPKEIEDSRNPDDAVILVELVNAAKQLLAAGEAKR